MQIESQQEDNSLLLQDAENRLRRLSSERLRVVSDFLAYLEEREESEATAELLNIPGFEPAFREALKQAENGEVIPFSRVRRDV